MLEFTNEPQYAWVVSNLEQDKTPLLKLDLRDGSVQHVYSEEDVDLDMVYISQVTNKPLLAASMSGYPRINFFDSAVQDEFNRSQQQYDGYLHFVSGDNTERTILVTVSSEKKIFY